MGPIHGARGVVAGLVMMAVAACGRGDREVRASPAEGTDPGPTDAEIAHIAVTANSIDAELARLAESRATRPEVVGFAQTMMRDHTGVNERAAALAERLGVTPQENAVSRSLLADAEAARGRLEPLEGLAFDRAYMQREVEYHQAVLDALDQTLIPGATNAELEALLKEVRPVIAAHKAQAETIRSGLERGG